MQKHTFSKYLPELGKLCEDLSESIFAFTDGWVLTIDAPALRPVSWSPLDSCQAFH